MMPQGLGPCCWKLWDRRPQELPAGEQRAPGQVPQEGAEALEMLLWRWRGRCRCQRRGQEGLQVCWDVEKVWKLGDPWTVGAGRVGGDQSERLSLPGDVFLMIRKYLHLKEYII